MTDTAVRVAGNADRAQIAASLARAFAEDPAITFIFPDPAVRARKLPRLFALLFDADDGAGMRLTGADGSAATLWRGPGRTHSSRLDMLRRAPAMILTFGTALSRALAVADAIQAHAPQGDYWYLHIAGCDPAMQGRGLGRAVVQSGLDRIVGGGLPVYLETPLRTNIGFYRGLGFAVTDEWRVRNGGPQFWSMLRPAT